MEQVPQEVRFILVVYSSSVNKMCSIYRVPTGQEKVRKIFFNGQEKVRKFWNFVKSQGKVRKIKSKCQVCMISQVKSKNDVFSKTMYGYGSLLVLITPFIEYILKVTIKIIFHCSKTVCKFIN